MQMNDKYIYSEENLMTQIESGQYELGLYRVYFYTNDKGHPASEKTNNLSPFYLYPSGGTLRDENMNIVLYNSKFDTYRGFILPHNKKSGQQ